MEKIIVRSQAELDRIAKSMPCYIEIAFGSIESPAILYGSRHCVAYIGEGFYVEVHGSVRISAFHGSHVSAYDNVQIMASANSLVKACGNSLVYAAYGSQVYAEQSCTVVAYDGSWIDAGGQCNIIAHPNATICLAYSFCGNCRSDLAEFRSAATSFPTQWLGKDSV